MGLQGTKGAKTKALHDLATLKPESHPARLTSLIRRLCGYLVRDHRREYPESWGPIYYFPLSRVTWIVSILSIVMAGVLLSGAIGTLYAIQSPGARLGVPAAYTSLFTTSVGLLTNAKRSEIFTATAA
jgi:hypothetical protein